LPCAATRSGRRTRGCLATTGFLGGFTTFSAFSLEAALLFEKNAFVLMAVYVLASVGLSIIGLFIGLWIVRSLT